MRRERFEDLVEEAVSQLPPEFQERLENVAIVVEDFPTRRHRRHARIGQDYDLLGLYEGVPQPSRTSSYGMVVPDKITIFQKPIEALCGEDDRRVRDEVRRVIFHEIGHHFGIDDETLERLEREHESGS